MGRATGHGDSSQLTGKVCRIIAGNGFGRENRQENEKGRIEFSMRPFYLLEFFGD
jgi:hypothetical protein